MLRRLCLTLSQNCRVHPAPVLPRLAPSHILCHELPADLGLSTKFRAMHYTHPRSTWNPPTGDSLWKSMGGVSAQGKKRGRAKNTLKKKNLNIGQRIGWGKLKYNWPGLTSAVVEGSGKETKVRNMAQDITPVAYSDYQEALAEEARKRTGGGRRARAVHPLERGWSGGKLHGRHYGAPLSQVNADHTFENFDSILLEFKTVFNMTGNMGRVRRTSILMVTGNGQGAVGYSLASGKYGQNHASLRKAVNKAGLRLIYVERYENRTVYHDFFSQFGRTRVFVQQQPPGHGVVANRVIRAICEMVGIKDLYVQVEGATQNVQHLTKAFMLGLLRQKTHQALADEKQLHLVEMRAENDYFPRVVASPSDGKVRTAAEIGHNEILDYEMICFEGNMPHFKPRGKINPWEGTPGWDKYTRKKWATRSHPAVRQRMRVENGDEWGAVRSHLYTKYPECVERNWQEYIKRWRQRKGEAED